MSTSSIAAHFHLSQTLVKFHLHIQDPMCHRRLEALNFFRYLMKKQLLAYLPSATPQPGDWMPYPSHIIPLCLSRLASHLYSSAGLLLRERCEAKVGLHNAEVWEQLLGLLVCLLVSMFKIYS
jgi:hypothetical protein